MDDVMAGHPAAELQTWTASQPFTTMSGRAEKSRRNWNRRLNYYVGSVGEVFVDPKEDSTVFFGGNGVLQ